MDQPKKKKSGTNTVKSLKSHGRDDCLKFLPEQLTVITEKTPELEELGIRIVEDKNHVLYDGLPHDPPLSLTRDIKRRGMDTPIRVRRAGTDPETNEPIIEVVLGRDRVIATARANKELKEEGRPPRFVLALVSRGDDRELYAKVAGENNNRKVLSPYQRAMQAERMRSFGDNDETIMDTLRISAATLRNYRALLECSSKVQKAVDDGRLSVEGAIELHPLSHPEQDKALVDMVASGATKGQKAVEAARAAKEGRKAGAVTTSRMKSRSFCEKLVDRLGEVRGPSAKLAKDIVSYLLGQDAALKRLPPQLAKALAGKA